MDGTGHPAGRTGSNGTCPGRRPELATARRVVAAGPGGWSSGPGVHRV